MAWMVLQRSRRPTSTHLKPKRKRQILQQLVTKMQHENWIAQARDHWKEHLPEMFARLKQEGKMEQALTLAAFQTAQEMRNLTKQGIAHQEAWEQVREQYLFLPEEKGQSPRMPKSQGYLAHRELMQGYSTLGQSEE